MKYLLFFLCIIPARIFAQQPCEIAYVHALQVLDSLPVTPEIKSGCQIVADSLAQSISLKKKEYRKKYKDPKTVEKKIKQDEKEDSVIYAKAKSKMMQKLYMKKINAATLVIYDKGKKYNSVINADSPLFPKLPDKSCDETANCLRIVREMLKSKN